MRTALAHYERLSFEVMPYTEGTTWTWARLGPAELQLFVKDDHDRGRPSGGNADELGHVLSGTGADGTSDTP